MTTNISSIFQWLGPELSKPFLDLDEEVIHSLEEIRIRLNQPMEIIWNNKRSFLKDKVTTRHLEQTLNIITGSSIYALEEELKQGYLTLPGGHRVGLVGKAVLSHGDLRTQKNISSLNFRIAREHIDAGKSLLPYLTYKMQPLSTLIVSPPCCGKTTLLRDLVRLFSEGNEWVYPQTVGLVDERSEIAAVYQGVPQLQVGSRTDIIDGCPKAIGMNMLVRSMAPQVIATDEVGSMDDILALEQALNSGISLLCTVHGSSLKELQLRPVLKNLINNKLFKRIVILSNRKGVGTIEQVLNGTDLTELRKEGMVC